MVVEDTGDLGDVADGKADEHGALGLKPIRSPCLSDFAARVETVFGGRGAPFSHLWEKVARRSRVG